MTATQAAAHRNAATKYVQTAHQSVRCAILQFEAINSYEAREEVKMLHTIREKLELQLHTLRAEPLQVAGVK